MRFKAKVLHKERQGFFVFVLFLILLEVHYGCVFHSGTGTGLHGQVRWARPTNTCVFPQQREQASHYPRWGPLRHAWHPPALPFLCHAVRISLLIHWNASGGGGVGGPGRLGRCDSSLALIRSARTKQNTRLIVIIDAETAVDGGGGVVCTSTPPARPP